MKIAIVSDIHSNLHALGAAIKDIKENDVELIINLGDIIGYGAFPNECVDLVKDNVNISLMGNHEYAVCGLMDYSSFNRYAKQAIEWTMDKMVSPSTEFIKNLNLKYTMDNVLYVHASPIFPENWEYVLEKYDADYIFKILIDDIDLIFYGHTHIPCIFSLKENYIEKRNANDMALEKDAKYMINVGSIGQPRDGDTRGCYVIYDNSENTIEFRRFDYNIDNAMTEIIAAGLPQILAERLRRGK